MRGKWARKGMGDRESDRQVTGSTKTRNSDRKEMQEKRERI